MSGEFLEFKLDTRSPEISQTRERDREWLIFKLKDFNEEGKWNSKEKGGFLDGEIPKKYVMKIKFTIKDKKVTRPIFNVPAIRRDFVLQTESDEKSLDKQRELIKQLDAYTGHDFDVGKGDYVNYASLSHFPIKTPPEESVNSFPLLNTMREEGFSGDLLSALTEAGISPDNYERAVRSMYPDDSEEDLSEIIRLLKNNLGLREQEPEAPPSQSSSSSSSSSSSRASGEGDVKPPSSAASGAPGGGGDDDDEDDDKKKREKKSAPIKKMFRRRVPRVDGDDDIEGGSPARLKPKVSSAIGRVEPSELQKGTEYLIDLVELKLIKSGSFNPIRLYVDYEKVKKDEFADVFHHFLRVTEKGGYDFIEYGAADSQSANNTAKAMGEIEILKRLLNITEKKIDSVEKLIKDTEEELTREINRGRDAGRIAKLSKNLRKIKKERASLDQIIKKATTEAENPFKDVATEGGVYSMPLAPPDIKRILEKNSIYSVQTMDLITTSMNETFSKIVNKAINYTNGDGQPALANAEDSAVYNCVIGRTRPRQATKEREIIPEGLIKTRYAYAPPGAAEVLGVTNPQAALLAAETKKYGLMNPSEKTPARTIAEVREELATLEAAQGSGSSAPPVKEEKAQ